jgi:cobalt/nickel transport system permease protein
MVIAATIVPFARDLVRVPGMHIPDGFLDLRVAAVFWVVALVLILTATRRVRGELGEREIPLMGVLAAFIFAAQMINFPVAAGTSGHLLGGALAAIVLGPWAGMLAMTAVVVVQGLLLQDGGLVVMGANIVNMGLLTALVGYGLYHVTAGRDLRVRLAVAGVAAWLSVMAAAFATSIELWLSGTSALRAVLAAMLGVHAIIGLGEALITVAALTFIARVRPGVIAAGDAQDRPGRTWAVLGLIVTGCVVVLAPYASTHPDGLERVAEDLGFLGTARPAPVSILPDYTVPGIPGDAGTVVAGAVGAVVVAVVVLVVARLVRRRGGTA